MDWHLISGENTAYANPDSTVDNIIVAASSIVTKDLVESNYIYVSNTKKKYFNNFEIEEEVLFH